MKVTEVVKAVAEICHREGDSENQASLERELYVRLLRSIEDGTCVNPVGCIRVALRVDAMDFRRG